MPILNKWDLTLTTDQVLHAQGAEPETIKVRRPTIISTTNEAIERSRTLLAPQVLYEIYSVARFAHERIDLQNYSTVQNKRYLSGKLIADHLYQAEEVVVMLCTIGRELENTIASLFSINPTLALAMDGVGSAAVEMLAIEACNYFEVLAHAENKKTSIPLNPGMIGWPVEMGLPQIFSLLDSEMIEVEITESCMMLPGKSLSIVLGLGKNLISSGSTCDYCSLKEVCKYQDHYAKRN